MIIDCHGHYTTAPQALRDYRKAQIDAFSAGGMEPNAPVFADEQIQATLVDAQLRMQRERGTDLTIFSPIASMMGHHFGDEAMSQRWSRVANNLIHQVCRLFPDSFVGACQLPQSPSGSPANCVAELERCVRELGFVGCNLNPDPSGGHWQGAALTDRSFYPLYEKMVELDVPAMIHVTSSCAPAVHHTGAHYLNGDTTAFMQLLLSDLFKDFPTLRFIIPHGGGAVPFHWGRYRGLAQDLKRPKLTELIRDNIFFDTCVYHFPGVALLADVISVENILFASEMIGAVKCIDPETGYYFDDTKRYVDKLPNLTEVQRQKIFEGNARRVFPRLDQLLSTR